MRTLRRGQRQSWLEQGGSLLRIEMKAIYVSRGSACERGERLSRPPRRRLTAAGAIWFGRACFPLHALMTARHLRADHCARQRPLGAAFRAKLERDNIAPTRRSFCSQRPIGLLSLAIGVHYAHLSLYTPSDRNSNVIAVAIILPQARMNDSAYRDKLELGNPE
jgi:hypothetical protein